MELVWLFFVLDNLLEIINICFEVKFERIDYYSDVQHFTVVILRWLILVVPEVNRWSQFIQYTIGYWLSCTLLGKYSRLDVELM